MAGQEQEKPQFAEIEYTPPAEVVAIATFCADDKFQKFHIDGSYEGNLGLEIRGYRKLKVPSSKLPEELRSIFSVGYGFLDNPQNKITPIVSNYRLEAASGQDQLSGLSTNSLLIVRQGIEK